MFPFKLGIKLIIADEDTKKTGRINKNLHSTCTLQQKSIDPIKESKTDQTKEIITAFNIIW